MKNSSDAGSDAEEMKSFAAERVSVWKQVVAQRQKLCKIVCGTFKAAVDLDRKLASLAPLKDFKGSAGESHVYFNFCADLVCGKVEQPWNNHVPFDCSGGSDAAVRMEYILCQTKSGGQAQVQVVGLWDGCSKRARKKIEEALSKWSSQEACEVVTVYSASPGYQPGKHRVFFGSKNVEVLNLLFPICRAKMETKDRSKSVASEETTHFVSYTGVQPLAHTAFPLMPEGEKRAMDNLEAADLVAPPKWKSSGMPGVPMFWNESKSVLFWSQFLDDIKASLVVDVTPGSGSLAQAAMQRGIPYVGLVASKPHSTWLSNNLDRKALLQIVDTTSILYDEALAEKCRALFADALENAQYQLDAEGGECEDDEADKEDGKKPKQE